MSAPSAELVKVFIGGVEREIAIQPTVFSRKSIDAMAPVHKRLVRDGLWKDMLALAALDIDEEEKAVLKQEYIGMLKKIQVSNIADAIEMLQSPDGMVVALQVNAGLTREEANEVINGEKNLLNLYKAIMTAAASDTIAVKN